MWHGGTLFFEYQVEKGERKHMSKEETGLRWVLSFTAGHSLSEDSRWDSVLEVHVTRLIRVPTVVSMFFNFRASSQRKHLRCGRIYGTG